jgi:hypothetical protein
VTVTLRLLRTALILAAVAVSACGKRGDPLPPIRPVPGRIVDLVARRVDDRVELRFTVPATNNDGTTPSLIDRIEVYRTMSTEDANAPSAVMLLNKKNLIGVITVRRPPPPDAANAKDAKDTKTTADASPSPKNAAPTPAGAPGPGPGELAIYTDDTPVGPSPATAVRNYMLLGWAGNQQQRSPPIHLMMTSATPPRPVEKLAADFDATSIKVTWVGPPLLFLPVKKPGSPLPVVFLPVASRPAAGQLPISPLPKGSSLPAGTGATPAAGALPSTVTTNPATAGPPPSTPPTGLPTTPPSGTGATGTTTMPPTATTTPTTGTLRTPGLITGASAGQTLGAPTAAGAPGAVPGMTPPGGSFGPPSSVAVGPVRGYRVTEVDESGHELTPNAPLPPPISASQFTLPVAFDKTRCFVVRTVDTLTGSIVMESAASAPVCVTPKDTFPPPAPTELRAFGGAGVVLTWTGVEAPDLAGYVVLRGEGAGDNMQPLNTTPITDTTFSDTTVKSGVTYVYAVIAVDNSPQHNPSAQSNKQTIVAR